MDISKNAYVIVIKDDEKSNYYYNYIKPSWEKAGIRLNVFDAYTPSTIPPNKLQFHKYSEQTKYTDKGIKAEITETEIACFHSHFALWEKAVELNEPVLVVEHDTMLLFKDRLWYKEEMFFITFDEAMMGCYIISPHFAKLAIEYCKEKPIGTGPAGVLHTLIRGKFSLKDKQHLFVDTSNRLFRVASTQVLDEKVGTTIEHFYNNNLHLFKDHKKHIHNYTYIRS